MHVVCALYLVCGINVWGFVGEIAGEGHTQGWWPIPFDNVHSSQALEILGNGIEGLTATLIP